MWTVHESLWRRVEWTLVCLMEEIWACVRWIISLNVLEVSYLEPKWDSEIREQDLKVACLNCFRPRHMAWGSKSKIGMNENSTNGGARKDWKWGKGGVCTECKHQSTFSLCYDVEFGCEHLWEVRVIRRNERETVCGGLRCDVYFRVWQEKNLFSAKAARVIGAEIDDDLERVTVEVSKKGTGIFAWTKHWQILLAWLRNHFSDVTFFSYEGVWMSHQWRCYEWQSDIMFAF